MLTSLRDVKFTVTNNRVRSSDILIREPHAVTREYILCNNAVQGICHLDGILMLCDSVSKLNDLIRKLPHSGAHIQKEISGGGGGAVLSTLRHKSSPLKAQNITTICKLPFSASPKTSFKKFKILFVH